MRTVKPSREEIGAAREMWRIVCAPLNRESGIKEIEMATKPNQTTEQDTAIATREPQSLTQAAGSSDNLSLANLSEGAIADAIEGLRELDIAFMQFTPAEKVAEATKGSGFYITDVVTIEIANKKPKPGEHETKLVHVFKMRTPDNMEYASMFGVNSWRDRIANGFRKAAVAGIGVEVGPVKLEKMNTGNIQPAWVFAPQKGFNKRVVSSAQSPALA